MIYIVKEKRVKQDFRLKKYNTFYYKYNRKIFNTKLRIDEWDNIHIAR